MLDQDAFEETSCGGDPKQRLQLVVTQHDRVAHYPLPSRGIVVLGRSSGAGVGIDDPFVASRHAQLHITGRAVEMEDLGSPAGTFVSGRRLTSGDVVSLDLGTPIGIGRTVVVVLPALAE